MKAKDFEYNGKNLSDFGFIICRFDSGGLDTVDGAEIEFNTVPSLNGLVHRKVSATYPSCLETTMQICKYSCSSDIQEITASEHREISRWLHRKGFYKLKFLDEEHVDLYYEASIVSIGRIELDGKLYGLELNIVTNSPFPRKEPRLITIDNKSQNGKHSINDTSYEEGHIYPYTEITIGDIDDIIEENRILNIYNAIENRTTEIKGVSTGEIITMDYPIIQSSIPSHSIQNDFNWEFFRIANTYENSRNDLTISIPCTIKIKYSPIVKVGL